MKTYNGEQSKSALIFNSEEGLRNTVKDLLTNNTDDIAIIDAKTNSECVMKIQKQKFSLLVLNSNSLEEENKRFSELVFNDQNCSPNNIIILGEQKKVSNPLDLNINSAPLPLNHETFINLTHEIFGLSSGATIRNDVELKQSSANLLTQLAMSTGKIVEYLSGEKLTKDEIFKRSFGHISGDISGVMLLHSDLLEASFSVSFSKELYCKILEHNMSVKTRDPGLSELSFVSEICKQISTLVERNISDFRIYLNDCAPEVIYTEGHLVQHSFDAPVIGIRYSTKLGDVVMESAIRKAQP